MRPITTLCTIESRGCDTNMLGYALRDVQRHSSWFYRRCSSEYSTGGLERFWKLLSFLFPLPLQYFSLFVIFATCAMYREKQRKLPALQLSELHGLRWRENSGFRPFFVSRPIIAFHQACSKDKALGEANAVSSGRKTLRQCFVAEVAGVTFSDSDYARVPKFLNPGPEIFKFENPIPVPTQATIDATEIQNFLNLSSDIYEDSCYCRKWKMTPDPGAFFSQNPGPFFSQKVRFFTKNPDLVPKKNRRILPESIPALRIRDHLCKEQQFYARSRGVGKEPAHAKF